MQLSNILIHVVVAFAAVQAALVALPTSAAMPAPECAAPASATRACKATGDEGAGYPDRYVAYPEGDVVFLAPAGAGSQ